jgi:phosphoribosylformylglycinamidine synthase
VGVVGLLEHADRVIGSRFRHAGDVIVLFGDGRGELGGSEYLKTMHGQVAGRPPALDLEAERRLQQLLVELAVARVIHAAHDTSDGGLAVALAECTFGNGIGADVSIGGVRVSTDAAVNDAAALFGESASRVLVSADPASAARVIERAEAAGVPARAIGKTGGSRIRIAIDGRAVVDVAVADAERVWSSVIEQQFARQVA